MSSALCIVRPLTAADRPAWVRLLEQRPIALACDYPAWGDFLYQLYGHPTHALGAFQGEELAAVLPLTVVPHVLSGNYAVNAPFYGWSAEPLDDAALAPPLLAAAAAWGQSLGLRMIQVRCMVAPAIPSGWRVQEKYSSYLIDLNGGAEALWERIGQSARRQVRKSIEAGTSVHLGGVELHGRAWNVINRAMHQLGSPAHGPDYLPSLSRAFPDALRLFLVADQSGRDVAAGVLLKEGGVQHLLFGNVLSAGRDCRAGNRLYWAMLEWAAGSGATLLDLGRSLNGTGNQEFKSHWRPRRQGLNYLQYDFGRPAPAEINQSNRALALPVRLWKAAPTWLVDTMGPVLKRRIA